MDVVFFETAMVEHTPEGRLLFVLIDGSIERRAKQECVGIWTCEIAAGLSLYASLGSALKSQLPQGNTKK